MLPESFTPGFLRQLELLRLRSRRAFLGTRQGGHISVKRGHGIEFSDYRQYELGDDPRHIDWNVYARSERLYVKRFQEEQDLSVLLLLDSTASMAQPPGDRKWELAAEIALALAYVGLLQQDRVTVSIPGYVHSPFYSGAGALHSLSRLLNEVRLGQVDDFYREVLLAVSRVRFPGLAIFLSDFLMPFEELERIFNVLRAKNLDITAIQVLGPNDLNPLEGKEQVVAIDSETGEEVELTLSDSVRADYGVLLDEHNLKLRNFLGEIGVPYVLALSTNSVSDFVVNELSNSALLQ